MGKRRTLMMLSGGLDSYAAAVELSRGEGLAAALWIDYGQKAAPGELPAARRQAGALGIHLYESRIDIYRGPEFSSGLINAQLDDDGGVEQLWVPARNALLYSIGAAFAEALKIPAVGLGLNAEEARQFADNTSAFLEAADRFIYLATAGRVRAVAPTVRLTKEQIVGRLLAEERPLDLIYSCYRAPADDGRMCGACPSCRRLKAALAANGLETSRSFLH